MTGRPWAPTSACNPSGAPECAHLQGDLEVHAFAVGLKSTDLDKARLDAHCLVLQGTGVQEPPKLGRGARCVQQHLNKGRVTGMNSSRGPDQHMA